MSLQLSFSNVLKYAISKHKKQERRGREPYVLHCIRVYEQSIMAGIKAPYSYAALLHDVIEDTPTTLDDLRTDLGLPEEVLEIINLLTKLPTESNPESHIQRLLKSGNKYAITIKFFDAQDNSVFLQGDKEFTKEILGKNPETERVKYLDIMRLCYYGQLRRYSI